MSIEISTTCAPAVTIHAENELQDFDLSPGTTVEMPPATTVAPNSETVSDFNIVSATDRVRKLFNSMKVSAVGIGKEFITVKAKLPHGAFGKWLDTEFDMTDRTAQNYMNAAMAVQVNEVLTVLPDKALYIIGARTTPSEIVEKVVTEIKAGNVPSARTIKADIQTARKIAAQERVVAAKLAAKTKGMSTDDAAKWKEKEEKRAVARKAREDAERAERKRKQEESEQMSADAVAFLAEHLGDRFSEFAEIYRAASPYSFLQAMNNAGRPNALNEVPIGCAAKPSNVVPLNVKKEIA